VAVGYPFEEGKKTYLPFDCAQKGKEGEGEKVQKGKTKGKS